MAKNLNASESGRHLAAAMEIATSSTEDLSKKRPLGESQPDGPAAKKASAGAAEKTPATPTAAKGAETPASTARKYAERTNGGSVVDVFHAGLARRAAWGEVAPGGGARCAVRPLTVGDVSALSINEPSWQWLC